MTSGDLSDRVTFYEPTSTTDDLGGQALDYSTPLATVWANWRCLTSRERLVAQAMAVIPEFKVTIYARTGISTQLRVERVGGDEGMCQVVAVTSIDDRRFLELDVVKVI
jgi:head-tail adaptor